MNVSVERTHPLPVGETRAYRAAGPSGLQPLPESSPQEAPSPASAKNLAMTPKSPFSQPDMQDSPSKGCNECFSLPMLQHLEDHELSGLNSLTGSELNLYMQVTEEMKREEPALARRLLQTASFKRRQAQAEAAAAEAKASQPPRTDPAAGPQIPRTATGSSQQSSSSGQSSSSQEHLSKELSDAVERLRNILPADAINLQSRDSFGLLNYMSSQSLSDSEAAAAAVRLSEPPFQQQQQQQQQNHHDQRHQQQNHTG